MTIRDTLRFITLDDSIYSRVLIAMVSLAFSMLLLVGGLSFWFTRHLVRENIDMTLRADAVQASLRLEHTLNSINDSLRNLSRNLLITNAIVDTTGRDTYILPFIKGYKFEHGMESRITLCDFMGKPIASNRGLAPAAISPELLTKTIDEGNGYAELINIAGQNLLVIAFPVVWAPTGKPEGLLTAEISLDELLRTTLPAFVLSNDRSLVLSSKSKVVFSKDKRQDKGFYQTQKKLALRNPLDTLEIELEIDDYREVRALWLFAIYAAAGVLLLPLTLLISRALARTLTGHLTELSSAVRTIAESGSLNVAVKVAGAAEVRALASAFNDMVDKVRDAHDFLEHRVQERTEQLIDANEDLRESELRFRSLFDNSGDPIFILDTDGSFLDVNRTACERYGYTKDTFLSLTIRDVDAPEETQYVEERMARIVRDGALVFATVHRDSSGQTIPVEVSSRFITLGGRKVMLSACRDITERMRAKEDLENKQRELEELNRNLEQRVAEELRKSREKDAMLFQQARQMIMGEMLVNIAHQWRQPLNVIAVKTQNLADMERYGELCEGALDSEVKEIMEIVKAMSHTIDTFRDFYAPAAVVDEFIASDVINKTVSIVNEYFNSCNIDIRLSVENERPVTGNAADFARCVSNILYNAKDAILARKINPGAITISVAFSAARNRNIITFSDNGGGIDTSIMARIFDPYFTTRFQGQGVGLGLFTVKQIIEKIMNGSVSAANTGTGAEFTLEV